MTGFLWILKQLRSLKGNHSKIRGHLLDDLNRLHVSKACSRKLTITDEKNDSDFKFIERKQMTCSILIKGSNSVYLKRNVPPKECLNHLYFHRGPDKVYGPSQFVYILTLFEMCS